MVIKMKKRKMLFLTGTRADYGKIKSLMKKVEKSQKWELHIFVTGMHMLRKHGLTWKEVEKDGFQNIYKFVNQQENSRMDVALGNTILGFSEYVQQLKPDLIVVYADRLEALAGAIVGAFHNIKVAHIEGGEVSGSIDESIRHAITKFSHIHFVSNEEAKKRVQQLGESEDSIYVIGSPDVDIMLSDELPSIDTVKNKYKINFNEYAILIYHPVTTEIEMLQNHITAVVDAILESNYDYVVIYPNNDEGSSMILKEYQRLENRPKIKMFPSIRFEDFLTLLKESRFIIGNSSAGIREASVYGIPAIDIGTRQKNRYNSNILKNIFHVNEKKEEILHAIQLAQKNKFEPTSYFGDGKSDERFLEIMEKELIDQIRIQKYFVDVDFR
jgi:UDP-N-acetylglucosamine 2-epimerase (hydrolysing)